MRRGQQEHDISLRLFNLTGPGHQPRSGAGQHSRSPSAMCGRPTALSTRPIIAFPNVFLKAVSGSRS